jgi:hypothetical protein
MAHQLSDNIIKDYLVQIKNMELIIEEHMSYISTIQTKINNIKIIMKNNCKHIPTIDHNAMNEHTEFYCSKCLCSL